MAAGRHASWIPGCAACAMTICIACQSDTVMPDYPRLDGSFSFEEPQLQLVAEEGYIGEDEFFVRYRQGEQVLYGGGRWSNRVRLPHGRDPSSEPTPYIVPLETVGTERWPALPGRLHAVRLLPIEAWLSFKRRFFDALLGPHAGSGVVLHFNVDDYVIYRDDSGEYQSVVLDRKPASVEIAASLGFADIFKRGLPMLEEFLGEQGIAERRIAFSTGDTGAYSLPFLYVNRDLPIAIFVRLPPAAARYAPASAATPLMQTAGHVTGSHTTSLVFRPLSSLYRLLFVVSDTVATTVLPAARPAAPGDPIPPLSGSDGMDPAAWERELDEITGRRSSRGTMRYLVDGEAFFTRLIDTVIAAEESIALRTYIFDNDDYATRIGRLLKRRSREGVDVRVLLDGMGTIVSTMETQPTLPEGYSGPASVHQFLEQDSRVDVRQAANPWLTGDHVKTAIIDRRIAFTGGMNIAREYRYDWHDLMVELQGPIVDVLQYEFDKAWAHAGLLGDFGYLFARPRPPAAVHETSGYPLRTLFTRPDDAEIFRAQRAATRRARQRIYVENAYFTDDAMLYELAAARRRGVDVRVIMPLVTDRGPITRNNALAANALLANGIRVFVYPGMSHVKAAVFDGWACLGSANWDRWSFKLNHELNIATSHPAAVEELTAVLFDNDFARSVELLDPFPERWSDHLLEIAGDYVF